ncbi:C-type natriuretic peptide 2-like [Arapaima gigas]
MLLSVSTPVTPRMAAQRSDPQVLKELFGPHISSLLLGQSELSEGSGDTPADQSRDSLQHQSRLLFGILGPQRRFRSRTRSSGRGCFGLKMDRIGAMSGLGC